MQLRFHCLPADPVDALPILEAAGHTCRWCGFATMYGMQAYMEDDEPSAACSVCHAARHAAHEDPRFRIIWAPEITQPLLSHLGRAIAFARVVTDAALRSTTYKTGYLKVDPRLFRELYARGDAIERLCVDLLDAPPARAIPTLPDEAQAKLKQGLRMLPVAFPRAEIKAWRTDESSLSSFTLGELIANRWFVSHIGMKSVHVSGVEDEEFEFKDMFHAR